MTTRYGRCNAFLWLGCVFWLLQRGETAVGDDGLCSVYTFVAFTDDGTPTARAGFAHMAAALLAMEHFNARNATVVPQLASLANCPYSFDMNHSRFFDTGTVGHLASRSLFDAGVPPCTATGTFHDMPALELSTMASAARFPMVVARASNLRVASETFSPFTTQVYPDMIASAEMLLDFLVHKNRTDFFAIVAAVTDSGTQRRETMTTILEDNDHEYFVAHYAPPDIWSLTGKEKHTVKSALEDVKKRGFRTIIVAVEDPFLEIPLLAQAAEELEMIEGYFWAWLGQLTVRQVAAGNEQVQRLMTGSVWVTVLEQSWTDKQHDAFYQALTSQGPDFVDRLNAANPMQPGEPGYYFGQPDYCQTISRVEYGCSFFYDSVMSTGIGMCSGGTGSGPPTGEEHLQGIRGVDFEGASGQVRFASNTSAIYVPGTRVHDTITWGAFNFLPVTDNRSEHFQVSDLRVAGQDAWREIAPFVYSDGTTTPPRYLRDPPNMNYLSDSLTTLGFFLFGTVAVVSIAGSVWIFLCRKHRVLAAAQPVFLFLTAVGSTLIASAIVAISFDESDGWNEQQLSRGCQAAPWLLTLGHILIYGSLFTKLWRVNKVLQFSRRKISVRDVAGPFMALLIIALIILSVWTAVDPLHWVRETIDDFTGDSIGRCLCQNFAAFAAPLAAVSLISSVMTAVMAWKTKDVDDAYAESFWIFILILIHIEVVVLAVPVIVILSGVSANGRYIGYVLLFWIFPASTLSFIMVPKMAAYYRVVHGIAEPKHKRGGAHGNVRTSGLDETPRPGDSNGDSRVSSRSPPVSDHNESSADHIEH